MLWFNSHIKVEGNTLYFKTWYRKGVIKMENILSEDGTILSCEEIQNKYSRNLNIIDYCRLHKTIPKEWKKSSKIR